MRLYRLLNRQKEKENDAEPEKGYDAVTDDLPVDENGYDPSVNAYKKKKGRVKGRLTAVICAAVLAVAGLAGILFMVNGNTGQGSRETDAVSEEKSTDAPSSSQGSQENAPTRIVELNTEYPGKWEKGKNIAKIKLSAYGGDVLVKLTVEAGIYHDDETDVGEGTWRYLIRIIEARDREPVPVLPEGRDINDYSVYVVGAGETSFSFVISREEIQKLPMEGLSFSGYNAYVKSAELCAAE